VAIHTNRLADARLCGVSYPYVDRLVRAKVPQHTVCESLRHITMAMS